jgi:uncharacterized membrane protein YccC
VTEPASIFVGNRPQRHSPWKIHWQRFSRFDIKEMEPLVALRNAIGVALPVAVGLAMGKPSAGVAAAVGALQVSYSDNPGPYHLRARRMLTATLLCSLAVVAGGLAIRTPVFAGAVILVWGFCAGLVTCLGEPFESLGTISLVTLIIYAAQPLSAHQALLSGLLAVSGGLLQTLLALLFWPVQRYGPERRELSALYRALSQAAITPAASDSPPASDSITAARKTLAAMGGDSSLQAERLWSLLNQAERVRLTLLAVRRLRARLQRHPNGQDTFQAVEQYLTRGAKVLDDVSESLSQAVPASNRGQALSDLEMLASRVRTQQASEREPSLSALQKDLLFQMEALAGQLRAAVRSTSESTAAALQDFAVRDARRPWRSRFFGTLAKLGANLALQSSAFRHAIRLTFCLAVGEGVAHLLHHPRSYWLAMTVVIVLKQEFAATLERGTLRIMGTIIGLVLATLLFHAVPPRVGLEVFLIGVMVFVLRSAGAANYGIFSIAMSALVVLLLAITGIPPMKLIFPRAEMTILGGLIALTTFVLWPTWERGQVPEILAQLLEAYRQYFGKLAKARIDGRVPDETKIGPARMAARLARSNMESSFERLRAEPATRLEVISLIASIMANSHRFVRAMMAVEVVSPELAPARPAFRVFAADVDRVLDALIRALRGDASSLRDLPDLREDHHSLVSSAASAISRYDLINEETDRMTNSLNTLAEQVTHWIALGSDFERR